MDWQKINFKHQNRSLGSISSDLKDKRQHAQSRTDTWNVLECSLFLYMMLILSLALQRRTRHLKHTLKRLLNPEMSNTKTHLWCEQISKKKRKKLLHLLFVERSEVSRPPFILTGWCWAGNYVTTTAADLQTLIRLLSLGKWNKGETDHPLSSPSSFHLVPSRQEWLQQKAIQTFVTQTEPFILMPLRHAGNI